MDNLKSLGKRQKRKILKEHRGILSRVARICRRKPQTVRSVYWGEGTSAFIAGELESQLRSLGLLDGEGAK